MTISHNKETGSALTSDRVAVVTGGAHGIGEAVVRRLAEAMNFTTIIADVDQVAAHALAKELIAKGARAFPMQLDVGSADSIREFFDILNTEFERCDILVNNAGIAKIVPFAEVTLEDWNAHLKVNVTGPLLMAQRAVPLMIRAHWGRIVNVTSISGIRASVGRTAYGTSKGALSALTRQMAVELASSCITVNAVAPGPVETAMAREAHTVEVRELYNSMVPLGRYVTPDEVAGAIAFLCSDDATYITGHTLLVDGGYVASGLLRF